MPGHFRLVMAIEVGDLKMGRLNCLVSGNLDEILGAAKTRPTQQSVIEDADSPSLLLSYYALQKWNTWAEFVKLRPYFKIRDWQLDSGAFSAHTVGAKIDVLEFAEFAKMALATDPTLMEVFSLDVIGDWRASEKNTEKLWAAGVPVIPTYHVGEPESVLQNMAKSYPKIALGGAVGLRRKAKLEWGQQCLARVWPKPVHGLGFGGQSYLHKLPLSSADSTNLVLAPCGWGNWTAPGRPGKVVKVGPSTVPSSVVELRSQVEASAKLERRIREVFRREGAEMDKMVPRDCREWVRQ